MKKSMTNDYIIRELRYISDLLADCWSGPLREGPKRLERIALRIFNLEMDIKEGMHD
jgi:hypothetical protein